jgi:peptidoglycan-associated lipoprotein
LYFTRETSKNQDRYCLGVAIWLLSNFHLTLIKEFFKMTRSFTQFMMLSVAVLALAACSDKTKDSMQETTYGDQTGLMGDGSTAVPTDGVDSSNIMPGSQEDLTVNVGDRVFFGYDRVEVAAEAKQTLDLQAEWLKRYPNVSVTIEGHADERGTREYNLALGDRRANNVRNYLIGQGVDASRIQTISYGKERPAVFGSDDQSWAQNRRAVTKVN